MAQPHSHPQVETLMGALKQLLRARGLRYRDIAERLGVTERTVKRWLADRGLTMNVVEDLCGVLGMSFIELCEFAKDDLDTRPQRLSREQERLLFSDLQLALVFQLLMRGWTALEIREECGLPEATMVGHLVRLERIKLVLFGELLRIQVKPKIGDIVGQGAAEQKFHRKVVNALGVALPVGLFGFQPALRKHVAHGTRDGFELVAGGGFRFRDDLVECDMPLVKGIVAAG